MNTSNPSTCTFTIRGVNVQEGLARFAGDENRYRHWLLDFVSHGPAAASQIREAIMNGSQEAAIRLGTETIRNMVLACGLTDAMKRVPGIELHQFWGKVFDVATLSKLLARRAGERSDEVFTCGLLYDLGRLIMHLSLDPAEVNRICELEQLLGRIHAERTVVGFNYAELGAEVAHHWCFPLSICEAIRYHPTPLDGEIFSNSAALIHLAMALSSQHEVPTEEPECWPRDVAARLGLDWTACREELYLCRQNGHGFSALLNA